MSFSMTLCVGQKTLLCVLSFIIIEAPERMSRNHRETGYRDYDKVIDINKDSTVEIRYSRSERASSVGA